MHELYVLFYTCIIIISILMSTGILNFHHIFFFTFLQIEVNRRNCLKRKPSKSMQFKVNDKSVTFFASGMSRAVLG